MTRRFFRRQEGQALILVIGFIALAVPLLTSALSLVSKDDPPIYMTYRMAPDALVPSDPSRARSWKVHHVIFGVKLKEKMDALGVEADLQYPGAQTTYASIPQFFKTKLPKMKSQNKAGTVKHE